jgi:hypothetical protein
MFCRPNGTALYIGKAGDLNSRCNVRTHHKLKIAIKKGATSINFAKVDGSKVLHVEQWLIGQVSPVLNERASRWWDEDIRAKNSQVLLIWELKDEEQKRAISSLAKLEMRQILECINNQEGLYGSHWAVQKFYKAVLEHEDDVVRLIGYKPRKNDPIPILSSILRKCIGFDSITGKRPGSRTQSRQRQRIYTCNDYPKSKELIEWLKVESLTR